MKIYTKTGDAGSTGLFAGGRVSKASSVIEAYGSVDEANASIGFAGAACTDTEIKKELLQIQHDLHQICADLATPLEAESKVERIEKNRGERLEVLIDRWEKELTPLTQFILAGGTELSARLHLARTICRRAEREVVRHSLDSKINSEVIIYLNRLSDLLFVAARLANKRLGTSDILWERG